MAEDSKTEQIRDLSKKELPLTNQELNAVVGGMAKQGGGKDTAQTQTINTAGDVVYDS